MSSERKKLRDALLTPGERTQYLSLTQQLSWPARTTMPGLCYLVSELQQKTSNATVADLTRCNWVLRQAQEMSRNSCELRFLRDPAWKLEDLLLVVAHDASFGNQSNHGSQQGYVCLLGGSTKPLSEHAPGHFHMVDWGSSKIHRVVRSTLAAEAASASHAHDRGTLIRYALAWLVLGPSLREQGRPPHWTEIIRAVRYALCTDCRSLSEHCSKCSSGLTEKRVGLDIADLRASVDAGDSLLWQPTDKMVADGLTKHFPKEEHLMKVTLENSYQLAYSKADS